jgi:hypothetical protein
MTKDDIFLHLARILGPLKVNEQREQSQLDKFTDLLRQVLTQPALEIKKTGLQFPDFQSGILPDEIVQEFETIADEIVATQPTRKPDDPVYWLRQRNINVKAGIEEMPENFLESEFSFGPFFNGQTKETWFDFFRAHRLLRFEISHGIPDFIVITIPPGTALPNAGTHTEFNFEDCTIWINGKTMAPNTDKKFVGIRAKKCALTFPGTASVQASGIVSIMATSCELVTDPYDIYANGVDNSAQPKASYPDKAVFSFAGVQCTLRHIRKSFIKLNGDEIKLEQGENIAPAYLEHERLIYFPLASSRDSWKINSNNAERFLLDGKAAIGDVGWYLPVITSDTPLGIGGLGMNIASGYLGFRGKEGLTITWPGLENGKLTINKFLMLARPGRMNLKYHYDARPRIKQQLRTWAGTSGAADRSVVKVKPLPAGEGNCIADNQALEAILQPVEIAAIVDRPLYSNQQRAKVSGLKGLIIFVKINKGTSVFAIGSKPGQPVVGEEVKQRRPQSLCLRNALLITHDPISIFLEGNVLTNDFLRDGFFYLVFPIYRLINTLPDPYITSQQEIFESDFDRFRELWRAGEDVLPNRFLFTVTSVVRWNDEETLLNFHLNQRYLINRVSDWSLLDMFNNSAPLCEFQEQRDRNVPLAKIMDADVENVVGAYGFMEWLPGNRSLVDVSGRANLWGVSFSATIDERKTILAESLGYSVEFPFRIKDLDVVSSGRISRLFTLPHIQWEPVMSIENPLADNTGIPRIINFSSNGNPTRLSSARKTEVVLAPRNLYEFIVDGFNSADRPYAVAAHFTLPFGICAFAYFNPREIIDLPQSRTTVNSPEFSNKKVGAVTGGMQLHVEALPPPGVNISDTDNHLAYFVGSATQFPFANSTQTILGDKITPAFNNEFSTGPNARVPLERIDFAGYGASIFSKWLNESANFGRVSQVTFDVMIGRTAHEVIQIKSILFPWGVPVVRSIVIQRKNTAIVTRYDSGWVATGPGKFEFLSNVKGVSQESSPYVFHPGMVTGIYDVREIRDVPKEMDITIESPPNNKIRFTGVYFNGDIEIENIVKGAWRQTKDQYSMVHSVGQFGYVMLADTSTLTDKTTLATLFPADLFKQLLNDPKIGGSLGGPVNAVMNIASSGQRMQVSRVDVSPSNGPNVSFVVSVKGTVELPKEGSWAVVKCLPSKDVIPLNPNEAVPVIRHRKLTVERIGTVVKSKLEVTDSHHCLGDPADIDQYAPNASPPGLQYSILQSTDAQKLLFRRPSFSKKAFQKIATEVPDLADSFRLLKCNTIFPNLSQTLSLPANVKELVITGEGRGLKFDEGLFTGLQSLKSFVPPQITIPPQQVFPIIDESAFKVLIKYSSKDGNPSSFQVDLNSDAMDEALEGERKKWETINKDVVIEVHLGPLKPLLTLRGQFRSEAGKQPEFENPQLELGNELQKVKDILQVLATLSGQGDVIADSLKVVLGNSPNSWNYKMSIEQRIPVLQFPSTALMTLTTPPPLIIEASLLLGVFFNLSLSPDSKNLIKPGAGAVLGFEGMIQIQLLTIAIAAAYGVGITKVKAYVDLADPKPQFEFTFGFGGTVVVSLPVVGLVSVTRSFSLTGDIDSGGFLIVAGQMLRGVLSLAGGLLIVAIQIEGKAGVQKSGDKTTALFEMIFSLNVSLAFVIKYNFSKPFKEEITLSQLPAI